MANPTILILDPHRELADMAGEVLKARGFSVVVAERFEAARKILQDTPSLQVAVCHATLPSEEGGSDVPILRELDKRKDVAVVVISSRPFEDVSGIPAHAVRLAKPFGANELLDAISHASGLKDAGLSEA
jgi:DNA-binding response OmpR family regulator